MPITLTPLMCSRPPAEGGYQRARSGETLPPPERRDRGSNVATPTRFAAGSRTAAVPPEAIGRTSRSSSTAWLALNIRGGRQTRRDHFCRRRSNPFQISWPRTVLWRVWIDLSSRPPVLRGRTGRGKNIARRGVECCARGTVDGLLLRSWQRQVAQHVVGAGRRSWITIR